MKNLSFRSKILLGSLLPTLVIAVIVSASLISYYLNDIERAFQSGARTLTDGLASELSNSVLFDDQKRIRNKIHNHLQQNHLAAVIIENKSKQTKQQFGQIPAENVFVTRSSIIRSPLLDDVYVPGETTGNNSRRQMILGSVSAYFSTHS